MKRLNNKLGFTLAELLMAIAILTALMGIVFVSVNEYMKSLHLLELDGIAKEMFIASQNQLSKAKENGALKEYLSLDSNAEAVEGTSRRYIVYPYDGAEATPSWQKAYDMLLPFGAIDDTVRTGGSFIIDFDPNTATVVQVYYTDDFTIKEADFDELNKVTTKEGQKNFGAEKHVFGMCRGENVSDFGFVSIKKTPVLEVENANQLAAIVRNIPNAKADFAPETESAQLYMLLCVKGLDSDATKTFLLEDTTNELVNANRTDITLPDNRSLILDDVTSKNKHFANLMGDDFIPGEDIEVFVTLRLNNGFSNVVESNHIITNSLFASVETESTAQLTAQISNYRHLENLDSTISGISYGTGEKQVNLTGAKQVEDLTGADKRWAGFIEHTISKTVVDKANGKTDNGEKNYYPVCNLPSTFEYNGNNRIIDGVVFDGSKATVAKSAGLFGTASNSLTVRDLELRNFDISVSGANHAGVLVGNSQSTLNVTNVVAYNVMEDDSALEIQSQSGSAGGLIGNASNATVEGSAAAVYVKGGTAGGLIGTVNSGNVTNSYSGGHTSNGNFLFQQTGTPRGRTNVIAGIGRTAGGLIGSADSVTVSSSYSASSVDNNGITDQLLIGNKKDSVTITDANRNYFAGWTMNTEREIVYPNLWMADLADNTVLTNRGITKYNYDPFWANDYYPFRTIAEMTGSSAAQSVWFLKNHVGDWALPGIRADIVND